MIIESDSLNQANILNSDSFSSVKNLHLVDRIKRWPTMEWNILLQDQFREGNMCANWLGVHSLSLSHGLPEIQSLPQDLSLVFFGDLLGPLCPD